ncbi:MAG TPA: PHB depolymerase family esterase [Roseiflexaceae bacterium]|nr:PHB depolymerase family esterase [Roseiflexaceae bacterium]
MILIAFTIAVVGAAGAVLLWMATGRQMLGSGDHKRTLTVDGRERSYLVHIPSSYDGSTPYPVVLVFHGGGSNAEQLVAYSGMNETADRNRFIAVYPNGTGETVQGIAVLLWNGGPRQPGGEVAGVDDVRFTRALLDDLATVVRVDERRIYASGMSMGGIMVYRLASELSDRIAAIASIAGPMGTATCDPTRPVSVLHVHGTADEAVPFNGGVGRLDQSGTDFYSADYSIQAWVRANGANPTPTVEALPDTADDGTRVSRQTYGGGKDGTEVVLVTIEGGGHTWPGRDFGPGMEVLGVSTKDILANDVIWEFFAKHPMK